MADSPSRLLARARRASCSSFSFHSQTQRPLPVWLYLPNLICYLRLGLSAYGLSIVAETVRRRAEATAAAAAASPFKAVARLASSYVTTAAAAHPAAAGGLLVSGTLLGRGLDHLLRAASQSQAAGGSGSGKDAGGGGAAVSADLLAAFLVFVLAAVLDALDGHLARAYDQCSQLGVVLDVCADIVLRSALWIAVVLLDARWALPALGFVTCEWLTLLASQVVSRSEGGRHWKQQREGDPWLVRKFFSRGFRNPLGVWGLGGLFLAPVWPLLRQCFPGWLLGAPPSPTSTDAVGVARRVVQILYDGVGWVVLGGRLLSLGIECYFILGLLCLLCEEGKGGDDEDGDDASAMPVKTKGL